jgi:hypothetical protein
MWNLIPRCPPLKPVGPLSPNAKFLNFMLVSIAQARNTAQGAWHGKLSRVSSIQARARLQKKYFKTLDLELAPGLTIVTTSGSKGIFASLPVFGADAASAHLEHIHKSRLWICSWTVP